MHDEITIRIEPSRIVTEFVRKLVEARGILHDQEQKMTRPFGQSPSRWRVLRMIAPEALTASQISRRLDISRQAAHGLIDELVNEGLVERVSNPDHAKSMKIRLTLAGKETAEGIRLNQSNWNYDTSRRVSLDELRQATIVLERFIRAVSPDPYHAGNSRLQP